MFDVTGGICNASQSYFHAKGCNQYKYYSLIPYALMYTIRKVDCFMHPIVSEFGMRSALIIDLIDSFVLFIVAFCVSLNVVKNKKKERRKKEGRLIGGRSYLDDTYGTPLWC